jgi:hypothetical protein
MFPLYSSPAFSSFAALAPFAPCRAVPPPQFLQITPLRKGELRLELSCQHDGPGDMHGRLTRPASHTLASARVGEGEPFTHFETSGGLLHSPLAQTGYSQ